MVLVLKQQISGVPICFTGQYLDEGCPLPIAQ